jgi:hypothetical protein
MALGWGEALLALLGPAIGGYGAGRQQLFANRRAQQDLERQDRVVENQDRQSTRDFGLRETLGMGELGLRRDSFGEGVRQFNAQFGLQRDDQADRFRNNAISAILQAPRLGRELRGMPGNWAAGVGNKYADLTGAPRVSGAEGNPFGKDPNEEALMLNAALNTFKTTLDAKQQAVGQPELEQLGMAGTIADLEKKAGLMPSPGPEFRDVNYFEERLPIPGEMPSWETGFKAKSNLPRFVKTVREGGYGASPATKQTQAQTGRLEADTREAEARAASIPAQIALKQDEIRADIQKYGMDAAIRMHGINATIANNIRSNTTTERGQDITLFGKGLDRQQKIRGEIDTLEAQRNKVVSEAADYLALLSGKADPATGKPLNAAQLEVIRQKHRAKGVEAAKILERIEEKRGMLTPQTIGGQGQGQGPGRVVRRQNGGVLITYPNN